MKENENEQSEVNPELKELTEDHLTVDRQSHNLGSSRFNSRSSSMIKTFGSQLDVSSGKKSRRSKCISQNYDLNQLDNIKQFIEQFDFKAMPVTNALRRYMNWVPIHGEAHVVDQRMSIFSDKYCRDNEIDGLKGFHVLVCSIILLNTDLHISKYGVKMSKHEYINNTMKALSSMDYTPTANELSIIYYSAKKKPLPKPITSKRSRDQTSNNNNTSSVPKIATTSTNNNQQNKSNVTYVNRGLRKTQTLFKSNTQLCVKYGNYSKNAKFDSPSSNTTNTTNTTNKADSCATPTASTNSESMPSFNIKKNSLSYGTIGASGRMAGELCNNDTLYEGEDLMKQRDGEDDLTPLNAFNNRSGKKSNNSEASYESACPPAKNNSSNNNNVTRFRLNSLRITSFKLTSSSKTSPTKATSELRGINAICKVNCYMIDFCDSLYKFYLTNVAKMSSEASSAPTIVCESTTTTDEVVHSPPSAVVVDKKKESGKRRKKSQDDELENFCPDSYDLSSLRKCVPDKHVTMEFAKTTLKLYKAVKSSSRHGRPLVNLQMTQIYAERLTETSFYTEKTQCMLLEPNNDSGIGGGNCSNSNNNSSNSSNNLLKSKNLQKIIKNFRNSMIVWDKDQRQSGYFFVFETAQDRDEMLANINLSNAVNSYVPLAVPSTNKPIMHKISYNTDLTITTLPKQYKKITSILNDFTKFYNISSSYEPEEGEKGEYNNSLYIVLRQIKKYLIYKDALENSGIDRLKAYYFNTFEIEQHLENINTVHI